MSLFPSATKIVKKPLLFYGWLLVLVGFLGNLVHDGVSFWTFGLFLKPVSEELGTSRTALTLAFSLFVATVYSVGIVIGPLLDRYGPRFLMAAGALLCGASLLGLSQVTSLGQFYLLYILVGLGVACFGGLVPDTVVAKWFVRHRGRATALVTMGFSTSGFVVAPGIQYLISHFGWRSAWLALGLMAWALLIVPALLFMRRQPEDMGLLPDGEPDRAPQPSGATSASQATEALAPPGKEPTWSLKEALRTPALWLIIVSFNLGYLSGPGFLVHLVPYLTDKGFGPGLATTTLGLFAFFMTLSKPFWGLLAERIHVRYCTIAACLASAVGLTLVVYAGSTWAILLLVVAYALARGGYVVLHALTWANYFGRSFLGTIRGVLLPLNLVSLGGGPLFAAFVYDVTHSYQMALLIMAALLALSAGVMALARPPRRLAA